MVNTTITEPTIGQRVTRFGERATVTRVVALADGDWLLALRFDEAIDLPCGEAAQRVDARASEVRDV